MDKRHLERGWCWRADVDGEPAIYGIRGHLSEVEAREIVLAYECDPTALDGATVKITQDYRRCVPCARGGACCGDCSGTHMERADGPGRGAGPYTWVEVTGV